MARPRKQKDEPPKPKVERPQYKPHPRVVDTADPEGDVVRARRSELARARAQDLDEQRWLAQQAAAESEIRRQILADLPVPVTVGDQRKMAELMAGMPLPVLLVELALRSDRMGKRAEAIKAIDAAAGYLYPTMKAVEMRIEGAGGPQVPQVVIELPPPSPDEVEQQHQARPFG